MPQTDTKRKPRKPKKNQSLELLRAVTKSMAGAIPGISDDTRDTIEDSFARTVGGIGSQVMGEDPETGDLVFPPWDNLKKSWNADERRKRGLPRQKRAMPGIAADTLSLPSLGGMVGAPVPQFAEDAAEQADRIHSGVNESMGLEAPVGFRQNAFDSLGVMLGQAPVPGKAKVEAARDVGKGALSLMKHYGKKALGAPAEFFAPTVDPSLANYGRGALFGGALGAAADNPEPIMNFMDALDQPIPEDPRIMRPKRRLPDLDYEDLPEVSQLAEGGLIELGPDAVWLDSEDEAAAAAFDALQDMAEEQGGLIFRNKEGRYAYSPPVEGDRDSFSMRAKFDPKLLELIALYHTHPDGDDSHLFSANDVENAQRLKLLSYIRDKAGQVRRFDPKKSRVKRSSDERRLTSQRSKTAEGDLVITRGEALAETPKAKGGKIQKLTGLSDKLYKEHERISNILKAARYPDVDEKELRRRLWEIEKKMMVMRIDQYGKGGKVGALKQFLRAVNMNPDSTTLKRVPYQIGDPVEEVLYAINEGTRKGVLRSDEAKRIKLLLEAGEDEQLSDALLDLHQRLQPKAPAAPTAGPLPLPREPQPGELGHGKMTQEEFDRLVLKRGQ